LFNKKSTDKFAFHGKNKIIQLYKIPLTRVFNSVKFFHTITVAEEIIMQILFIIVNWWWYNSSWRFIHC